MNPAVLARKLHVEMRNVSTITFNFLRLMKKIIALLLMAMVVTNAYAQYDDIYGETNVKIEKRKNVKRESVRNAKQDTVYYNVAGQWSYSPFNGTNIIVYEKDGKTVTEKKIYDEDSLNKRYMKRMPIQLDELNEEINKLKEMQKPTFSDSLSYRTLLYIDAMEDVDTIFINHEGEYLSTNCLTSLKLDYDRMVVCDPLNNTLTVYQIKILNPRQSKTIKSSGTRMPDLLVDVNYHGVRGHEWQKVAEVYPWNETIYFMAKYEIVGEPEVHEFDFTVYSGKR